MKIRIKGNSIRLRLTKTEIANFGKQGFLEEKTAFSHGNFLHYCIEKKAGIEELAAAFSGNIITLYVPEKMAEQWTATDIIGFNNKVDLGNGEHLSLLIEKDFVCLDHSFEDQSDNYPNPNAVC